MRIVFLCGSLESGKDGVGDYTRQLGIEMVKNGHQVVAISLFDRGVGMYKEEVQAIDSVGLPVCRIPFSCKNKRRFVLVDFFFKSFNPEWISLQFVSYSFHAKGLPFTLIKYFKSIKTAGFWHIMFHELWIGFTKISSLKHKVVGHFQRKILISIVGIINPELITTTNRLYQCMLLKHYINSSILPLFSNISIAPLDEVFYSNVIRSLSINSNEMHKWRFIGIFGNLHPQANLEKAIEKQLWLASQEKKQLAFIGIGRMNAYGLKEFTRLKEMFNNRVSFLHLGQQPTDKVSNLLQMLDVGISCTPKQHIAKSGVYAAMRFHGLQVDFPQDVTIPEYDSEIKNYYEEIMQKPTTFWGPNHVSVQFLNLLYQFSKKSTCND